ncbi:uncharacterized protein [Ptychodera flava]|uniref:uncharacterized protein n=1 Tax=Ptychodera flava TaxID=63121 RepID=UPI00396A7CCF
MGSQTAMLRIFRMFSVLLLIASSTFGRIYDSSLAVFYGSKEPSLNLLEEQSFGFSADRSNEGIVDFRVSCPKPEPAVPPSMWLLFCTTNEAREFSKISSNHLNFECHRLEKKRIYKSDDTYCLHVKAEYNSTAMGEQWLSQRVQQSQFFTFFVLQCPGKQPINRTNGTKHKDTCRWRLSLLNPDQSHLSSDESTMPDIYTAIMAIWAVMVLFWLGNWFLFCEFSNPLHKVLFIAPTFKILLVILAFLWWHGIEKKGTESQAVMILREIVQSIEDAMLFLTMMIASEGWCVLRPDIRRFRWIFVFVVFMIFTGSVLCVTWVHSYFLAFAVCSVVFIMYRSLKWCSYNIEHLRRQLAEAQSFVNRMELKYLGQITVQDQLKEKLGMYVKLRLVCTTYAMLYAVIVTLATFLSEYTWIKTLTFEIPELAVYFAIGFIFRLHNFSQYENIRVTAPKETSVVFILPHDYTVGTRKRVLLGHPLNVTTETFEIMSEDLKPVRRSFLP